MVKTQSKNSLSPKFLALGVLLSVFLAGCQQTGVAQGRLTSAKGVNIENLLPADLLALVKVGTTDQGQIDQLKELTGYFPNDPVGALVKEFNNGFKEGAKLDEVGLDYENDILPILSEKSMVVLGIAGQVSVPDKVRVYLAMTIADQGKMDSLLNRQLEKSLLVKAQYNGYDYYSEKSDIDQPAYFVRAEDVLLVTNDLDGLKKSLDNLKAGKSPLAENKLYQKMLAKIPANLAFLYADLPAFFSFMENAKSDQVDPEFVKTIKTLSQANAYGKMGGQLIYLKAEKDGLRLAAYISPKDGEKLNDMLGEKTYLAKEIPAENAVMYMESGNLKKAFEQFFDTLAQDPANGNPQEEMKAALASAGFDYEKDVLTMLSKGFAFVFEDTGSVIPSLGAYVDVSGNIEAAGRVGMLLDKSVDEMLAQVKKESPEAEMLVKKEVVEAGKLWKLKVDLAPILIGAPEEIGKKLSGQKIELYYGLLKGKMFVFALKPDLEKVYGQGKSVADGKEYQMASKALDADTGMVYLAPEQVFVYVDSLLKLASSAGAQPDLIEYNLIKSYFTPLKSLSSSSKMDGDMMLSQIFVHIGK